MISPGLWTSARRDVTFREQRRRRMSGDAFIRSVSAFGVSTCDLRVTLQPPNAAGSDAKTTIRLNMDPGRGLAGRAWAIGQDFGCGHEQAPVNQLVILGGTGRPRLPLEHVAFVTFQSFVASCSRAPISGTRRRSPAGKVGLHPADVEGRFRPVGSKGPRGDRTPARSGSSTFRRQPAGDKTAADRRPVPDRGCLPSEPNERSTGKAPVIVPLHPQPRRPAQPPSARLRRPPTAHSNCSRPTIDRPLNAPAPTDRAAKQNADPCTGFGNSE